MDGTKGEPSLGLLILPREIRDEIYLAYVQARACIALDAEGSAESGTRPSTLSFKRIRGQGIMYPAIIQYQAAVLPLSRTNKQIRQEFLELSSNPNCMKHLDCEVDVLWSVGRLFPTWTWLPFPSLRMRHLQANIRFPNVRDPQHLWQGCGGVAGTLIPLFALLNQLLHHGPGFLYSGAGKGMDYIETLTINFVLEEGLEQGRLISSPNHRPARRSYIESIWEFIVTLATRGFLSNKVGLLRIHHGDNVREYGVVDRPLDARTMALWRGVGFGSWGPAPETKIVGFELSANM